MAGCAVNQFKVGDVIESKHPKYEVVARYQIDQDVVDIANFRGGFYRVRVLRHRFHYPGTRLNLEYEQAEEFALYQNGIERLLEML